MDDKTFEILMPIIILILVLGINIAVFAFIYLKRRKADAICGEMIQNHLGEIKMMVYAMQKRKLFSGKDGILIMFRDRIVFRPMGKGEIIEMPFTRISRIATPRFSLFATSMGKKMEIYVDDQKRQFYINPYVYGAWRAAIEKISPSAGPQPIG